MCTYIYIYIHIHIYILSHLHVFAVHDPPPPLHVFAAISCPVLDDSHSQHRPRSDLSVCLVASDAVTLSKVDSEDQEVMC